MDFSVKDIDQYSVDVHWKVDWTLIDFPLTYRITYKIIARWSDDLTHVSRTFAAKYYLNCMY